MKVYFACSIRVAEGWGKPVLALFRDDGTRELSAMIDGSPSTTVVYCREIEEAYKSIDNFLTS